MNLEFSQRVLAESRGAEARMPRQFGMSKENLFAQPRSILQHKKLGILPLRNVSKLRRSRIYWTAVQR
jgi:hypothetical protein